MLKKLPCHYIYYDKILNMKKIITASIILSFVLLPKTYSEAIENKKNVLDRINFNFSSNLSDSEKFYKIAEIVNVGDQTIYNKKNPLISAGLSFVMPGAGQVYNEEYLKGALLFVGVLGLAYLDFFIIEPNAKINDNANKLLPENEKKNNSLFDLAALFVRVGLPSLWVYNWGSAYQSADPVYQKKLKEEIKKNKENTPLSNNLFNIKMVKINF